MKIENCKFKIIFMGTPDFGSIILEKLAKSQYKPSLVITAPDKPIGRKQILTPPATKISAQKYKIPILQPEVLANYKLEIINYRPDLIIVAAYGHIIPKNILDIPKYGCLNIHPSLLPKHRGPSPIQAAILNGDKKTGVTIMLMDKKIDHGPILAWRELEIQKPNNKCQSKSKTLDSKITFKELSDKLAKLGAKLLIETIPKWINGEIKPRPQDDLKATYTKIIKKKDGKIDWLKPAEEIERQIRAFSSWPGAFTFLKRNDKLLRVKILEAKVLKKENVRELCVKTGKNFLIIKKLQLEGKKPITGEDFLKGYSQFKPLKR